jgi:hypothetical protein
VTGALLLAGVLLVNAPASVSQGVAEELWARVQKIAATHRELAPEVFFPGEEEPPSSPAFLAYYYERTNVIRVSPMALRRGLVPGELYLLIGHEMLHYALASTVPIPEHHCLFKRRALDLAVADYLIERGEAHPFLRYQLVPFDCEGKLP